MLLVRPNVQTTRSCQPCFQRREARVPSERRRKRSASTWYARRKRREDRRTDLIDDIFPDVFKPAYSANQSVCDFFTQSQIRSGILEVDVSGDVSATGNYGEELEILSKSALGDVQGVIELLENCQSRLGKLLTVGVLAASWHGNSKLLSALLYSGGNPNAKDNDGRTALHLAATSNSVGCLEILLEKGAEVDAWDYKNYATPLGSAAASSHLEAIQFLLSKGADANAGLTNHHRNVNTPLAWATRASSVDCVQELINHGASSNSTFVYTESPLHIASSRGDAECLEVLLKRGADTRTVCGADRNTALHLAAKASSVECVKSLLLHGIHPDVGNADHQTPLHLAAFSQAHDVVLELISAEAKVDAEDCEQRTPLHTAIANTIDCTETVENLLTSGADVNKQDSLGQSPLHLAALKENSEIVSMLIKQGANFTSKTKAGLMALEAMARYTPDSVTAISEHLDEAISANDKDALDINCQLFIDFRFLAANNNLRESQFFTALIRCGQRELLQHPLCRAFLYLKWHKIRTLFFISLAFYALFAIPLSFFVAGMFVQNCADTSIVLKKNLTHNTGVYGLILLLLLLHFLKELYYVIQNPKEFIKNWESWLQVATLLLTALSIYGYETSSSYPEPWQYHTAGLSMVLAWTQMMMVIGRFPTFGLYVQMFKTVTVNVLRFIFVFLCLVIGFSLGLAVLFPCNPSLKLVPQSFLTVLIMMTGQIETKIFFPEEKGEWFYEGTGHIVLCAFFVLMVIVLMNLLVGLAVNDIQGLQRSAALDRLARQARLIDRFESTAFGPCLSIFPAKMLEMLQNKLLLVHPVDKPSLECVFSFKPNDPRDATLPQDIQESIHRIAVVQQKIKSCKSPRLFHSRSFYNSYSEEYDDLDDIFDQIDKLTNVQLMMGEKVDGLREMIEQSNKKYEEMTNQIIKRLNSK